MSNLKNSILKNRINCNPAEVLEVMENMNMRTGKTFAIISNGSYISSFRKTLKGATAHAERSLTQWYDEYTMEMTSNVNEVIEITLNDLASYSTDITLWYEFMLNNPSCVTGYSDIKYFYNTYVDGFMPSKEVLSYIAESVERIQKGLCPLKPVQPVQPEVIQEQPQQTEKTPAIEEAKQDQQQTQPTTVTTEAVNVVYNEDKNGIELYFSSKPTSEVLTTLKANGFRWAKYNKCWYIKDTQKAREFIQSFTGSAEAVQRETTGQQTEVIKPVEPVTVDLSCLDDLDNYKIDPELSKRENDGSMFRSKDINHEEVLQKQLLSFTEAIKSIINDLSSYEQNKLLNKFQSFKTKYHKQYIDSLHAKINAPSWALTGRGNLNVNQYNKKQERLTNKYMTMNDTYNAMKSYIEDLERQIKKEQQQKELNDFHNTVMSCDYIGSLKKETVSINAGGVRDIFNHAYKDVTAYVIDGQIYIIKNWGSFHIYDNTGNTLIDYGMTLKDAKQYANYFASILLNNELKTA